MAEVRKRRKFCFVFAYFFFDQLKARTAEVITFFFLSLVFCSNVFVSVFFLSQIRRRGGRAVLRTSIGGKRSQSRRNSVSDQRIIETFARRRFVSSNDEFYLSLFFPFFFSLLLIGCCECGETIARSDRSKGNGEEAARFDTREGRRACSCSASRGKNFFRSGNRRQRV